MANQTDKLIAELRKLLRLTEAEIQMLEAHRAQARTEAVERDLQMRIESARTRAYLITRTLRSLGGAPDVVTTTVGRIAGAARMGLAQVQPMADVLIGDLGFEHQLQDRARYVQMLAGEAGESSVRELAERLEQEHGSTVEWLNKVLADTAVSGPVILQPTLTQKAIGAGLSLATLPVRTVSRMLNDVADSASRIRSQVRRTTDEQIRRVAGVRETAVGAAKAGRDIASETARASRDAAMRRTEEIAREGTREGEAGEVTGKTAETLHEIRQEAGALSPEELPVSDYDELNAPQAIERIKELQDPDDVRTVMEYEEAHRNRSRVMSTAQSHASELVEERMPS